MWVQLFLIFASWGILVLLNKSGDNEKSRHKFVITIIIILVLQSGLRNLAVGADTYAYYLRFNVIKFYTWPQIWRLFYQTYILGQGKDAGFVLLTKIFSLLCPYFRCYLFCIATAFFISLWRLLEKHLTTLKQLFIAFVLYETLFYGFFSITGLRQTIATIATFYGVNFINERKLFPFLITIFIASFIHKSVLIFIPFYFIVLIPKANRILLWSILILPFLFGRFSRLLALRMASVVSGYYSYAESTYQTSGAQMFLLFIILCSCFAWATKQFDDKAISDWVIHALSLALFFTPLTWIDPSFMRVVQYFSVFTLIALPLSLENIRLDYSQKRALTLLCIFVLVVTIIRHNQGYRFCWQSMELGSNYIKR